MTNPIDSILAELDALARRGAFPAFDDPDYATIDARMHLFRGASGWSLLIEEAVDWLGPEGPQVLVFGAGPGLAEGVAGILEPTTHPLDVTMDEEFEVTRAVLRGETIPLDRAREIAVEEDVESPRALLIDLVARRRDELFFRTEELRPLLRPDQSRLMRIDAWCHPDVRAGASPSASEAFQLAAAVLATGSISAWSPSETPNNANWKLWREGH